jgi:RNA polymerase sigma-70 factor, ECF subfamily
VSEGQTDGDDRALIERLRAGDRQAFGDLVKRHRQVIFRLVLKYVANDAEAEDVVQLVFINALRAFAGFRGESSVETWLHRIAVNAALNYKRDAKRSRTVSIEDVEIITNALGTGKLAAREVKRKLGAALEQLPPKQRAVVELRLVHEMPFRAIASITDSTEEGARANYHQAVKRLRQLTVG